MMRPGCEANVHCFVTFEWLAWFGIPAFTDHILMLVLSCRLAARTIPSDARDPSWCEYPARGSSDNPSRNPAFLWRHSSHNKHIFQLSRSNKRSVYLKHVDLYSEGIYRCEVRMSHMLLHPLLTRITLLPEGFSRSSQFQYSRDGKRNESLR